LKIAWWTVTAAILGWGLYLYQVNDRSMHHHVDEFVILTLWVVSFPLGLVVPLALTVILLVLQRMSGIVVPSSAALLVVGGLAISSAGFYQWFTLVPRVVAWSRRRRNLGSAAVEQ
jgi:hypothetical protein